MQVTDFVSAILGMDVVLRVLFQKQEAFYKVLKDLFIKKRWEIWNLRFLSCHHVLMKSVDKIKRLAFMKHASWYILN